MPNPSQTRSSRRSLARLWPLLMLTAAPAALAQSPYGATVQSLPQPGDPAELLAQALRTLAVEPSNLSALAAAGHNALALGDPNAAVGFFGRAQEIAPRDGHIKAGLGSALVELEKPQDALRLFAEASRLGVPDEEIAEDRGLAYDLTGDPKRAQHDYAAVLAAHPGDDTVRRRLALSQGISGDKAAAIATLDPLIRKRDIAGWRAQTFVLAMNGDAKGASSITHIMLPQQADMLQPFLIRLATLSPADKARAVNFGEMPAAGRAYSPSELANTGATPTYAARSRTASAATPAAPPRATPSVTARASDLAPIPAAASRPAVVAPRVVVAVPTPSPASAPLAGIALTPAPVATRVVSAPQPVVIAQATPSPTPSSAIASSPSAPGGFPGSDLPTPAAVGHYDLPHDSNVRTSSRSAPVAAATPTVTPIQAPIQTVGTPVVHGEGATSAPVVVPAPRPTRPKPVLADADTHATSPRKPITDESADAAPSRHRSTIAASEELDTAKGRKEAHAKATVASDGDNSLPVKKGGRTAHEKAAAPDDGDDVGAPKKAGKSTHGKPAASDASDDQAPVKPRKGAHGKAIQEDAADNGAGPTRKGAHATKAAAQDDSDDGSSKSRRSAHGRKPSDDEADTPSARSKKQADKSDKSDPERVFVQVAGGANKDDMDKAWAGVKKKAPDLMKGRTAQTMPIHATNRLMVGPFKSQDEAQAFVNKLAGKGLSGFTVKTGKGQKVEKVDKPDAGQ